jgi:hypothetical protein
MREEGYGRPLHIRTGNLRARLILSAVFDGGDEGRQLMMSFTDITYLASLGLFRRKKMKCRKCDRDLFFIKQGRSRIAAIHKGDTMPAGAVPVSGLTAERTEHYARKRLEEVCQGVKE